MDRADPSGDGLLPERYRDPVLIAVGGMGSVYRAHDERLGRDVAVKLPSDAVAADATASRRFRREAVSAARIHHPNVATVYDVGEHRGRSYMVMQLATGGTIADRLARGRPPTATSLAWLAQTAAALDAAHAAGVVHRDVKPANLLLDADDRVKVADFGVARVLGDQGATLTAAGTVLGTSGYASPEQSLGRRATPAGDVYSLAAVAFELLTGARPYAPRTGIAELTAHASAPVPSAREREPALPQAVDAVLARGLAKAPEERHPSAGAFVAALAEALRATTHPTAVMPVAAPHAAPPPVAAPKVAAPPGPRRRGRAALAAAAIVAAAGGVAAAAMVVNGGDDPGDRPAAASRGSTVTRTVDRTAPVAAPAPTPDEAVALTDRASAALEAGDAGTGLALAERALSTLAGTGADYEGNASYDRGRALIDLGRCAEAQDPLARAIEVGGTTWQVETRRDALKEARRCARGKGKGKSEGKGPKR